MGELLVAEQKERPHSRIVVEGDKPSTVDFAELPNSALKHLLRSGSQAAWDEAVDRIRRKAERGDYGPVEDGEDGDEESKPGREDSAKGERPRTTTHVRAAHPNLPHVPIRVDADGKLVDVHGHKVGSVPKPGRAEPGLAQALERWRDMYRRSGDALGTVELGLADVDEVGSSYRVDDPKGLLDRLDAGQRKAVGEALFTYATSTTSQLINRQLRSGNVPAHMVAQYVEPLDAAMDASRLDRPIVVSRGIHDPELVFGEAWGEDMTGLSWVEESYLSTAADERIAADFATQGRNLSPDDREWGRAVVMTLVVPEGTGAVRLSEEGRGQSEVLLQRGLRLRVVRDNGVDSDGIRQLDVEVFRDR